MSDVRSELREDGLLEITIDRPDKLNTLSYDVMDEITEILRTNDEADVSCVTVEGSGTTSFCAGVDIDDFRSLELSEAMESPEMIDSVAEYPRPTVAKIDGFCLGGGLELALACDLRIATTESKFGAPEIQLGLIPGGGATQRLSQIIGETRTKELVYRGNRIKADRAEDWGLINRSVTRDVFEDTVATFVEDLVSGPPVGLKVAKRILDNSHDVSREAAAAMESHGFGLLMETEDAAEGIRAFLEERDPDFEGQ